MAELEAGNTSENWNGHDTLNPHLPEAKIHGPYTATVTLTRTPVRRRSEIVDDSDGKFRVY